MPESIEANVRRIISDIVDGGDYSLMSELLSEDYVEHSPLGDITGREGFRQFIEQFRSAMPGFHHDVSDVRELHDGYVVFHVQFSGQFTGTFMGTEGDGRHIAVPVANAARFADGRLVEHWGLGPDTGAEIMKQMGIQLAPA